MHYYKILVAALFIGVISFGIIRQSFLLYDNVVQVAQFKKERVVLVKELAYWQQQSEAYPNHRDILVRVGALQYQLGDNGSAQLSIAKALQLDPNFIPAQQLAERIKQQE